MRMLLATILLFVSFLSSTGPSGRQKHYHEALDQLKSYALQLGNYKVTDMASSWYVLRGETDIDIARETLKRYRNGSATDEELDRELRKAERDIEDDPKTLKSL